VVDEADLALGEDDIEVPDEALDEELAADLDAELGEDILAREKDLDLTGSDETDLADDFHEEV